MARAGRTLTKLSGATGAVVWSADPTAGSGNAVATDGANDVVVAGTGNLGFTVAKLAGADGAVLWQYLIPSGIAARYCMLFGTVFKDQSGRFVATAASAPAACPTVP